MKHAQVFVVLTCCLTGYAQDGLFAPGDWGKPLSAGFSTVYSWGNHKLINANKTESFVPATGRARKLGKVTLRIGVEKLRADR